MSRAWVVVVPACVRATVLRRLIMNGDVMLLTMSDDVVIIMVMIIIIPRLRVNCVVYCGGVQGSGLRCIMTFPPCGSVPVIVWLKGCGVLRNVLHERSA